MSEIKEAVEAGLENSGSVTINVTTQDKTPTKRKGLYGTVITMAIMLIPMFVQKVQEWTGYDIMPIVKSIGQVLGIGG